mgnify:CR=1 FL=1
MPNRLLTRVVVDSTSSLLPEVIGDLPLSVVPLQITLNDQNYKDSIDLTAEEFYRRIGIPGTNTSTSAPTPTAFETSFAADKTDVLCITLSSQLSATYNAARLAMNLCQSTDSAQRIWLLDSATAGGAQGLIALAAARAAIKGETLEGVFQIASATASRVHFIGALETVKYLRRSGRIPRIASWTVSLLNIKPVLAINPGEGRIRMLAQPRSKLKAIEIILDFITANAGDRPLHVIAMHAARPDEAIVLLERIKTRFECLEALTAPFTPVIGAHTGPGLLGVAFYSE